MCSRGLLSAPSQGSVYTGFLFSLLSRMCYFFSGLEALDWMTEAVASPCQGIWCFSFTLFLFNSCARPLVR